MLAWRIEIDDKAKRDLAGLDAAQAHPVVRTDVVDILPRLKSGDSYGAHPGIEPE